MKKLEKELQETEAVESQQKRAKLVSPRSTCTIIVLNSSNPKLSYLILFYPISSHLISSHPMLPYLIQCTGSSFFFKFIISSGTCEDHWTLAALHDLHSYNRWQIKHYLQSIILIIFLLLFTQQTEILKFVFVTYFRVLKTVGHSPLLSPVLEGLAKFAHLINVDFFNDLMAALHTLLDNKVFSV